VGKLFAGGEKLIVFAAQKRLPDTRAKACPSKRQTRVIRPFACDFSALSSASSGRRKTARRFSCGIP
jgi:hypothetical protein